MEELQDKDALVAEIAARLEKLVVEVQLELSRLRETVSTLRQKWFHTDTRREQEAAEVLRRADFIQREVIDRAAQLQSELDRLREIIVNEEEEGRRD